MMHGECETLRGARELSNLRPFSLRAHVRRFVLERHLRFRLKSNTRSGAKEAMSRVLLAVIAGKKCKEVCCVLGIWLAENNE